MPRTGRLHIPGGYYHIIGRGLERRHIFKQTADKADFLERVGIGLERVGARCEAWAVMSNHYHLLICNGDQPLSRLMGPLLGGYATQYNRRHNRCGYVFQNRFRSILCDAEQYLLELVRYVHLNPLKAGMLESVDALDKYRWTGHAGILGMHKQPWHDKDEVLALFSSNRLRARFLYRQFIKAGVKGHESDLSGGGLIRSYGGWESIVNARKNHIARIGDERILGESDFVDTVLRGDELKLTKECELNHNGLNLDCLIKLVCEEFGISQSDIRQKTRNDNLSIARSVICYWGMTKLGLTTTSLAGRLSISQSAVSKSSKRGQEYCKRNKLLFSKLL